MKLDLFLKKLISILFPVLFFLVPLFFLPLNYELFEFNKIILVYFLTILIAAAWAGRMIIQKKFIFRHTPLEIPIAVFFLSQVISTIFSLDPHTSLFGYYSRFNGGFLSLTGYLLLYFAFVSNLEKGDVYRLIKSVFASGLIISIYGILEHFGHSFSCLIFSGKFDTGCWVQDVQTRVFATLGQPNWLAAYLAILIPIAIYFFITAKTKISRAYYLLLTTGYFACLLFTGSRSGFLGLVIALIIYWLLTFFTNRQRIKSYITLFIILNSLFLILVIIFGSPFSQINKFIYYQSFLAPKALNTREPPHPSGQGTQLEVGGTESGKIRQIVWKGAINVFRHYPFFGSGVETFAYSYYNFRPVEHNLVSEWDFLYNKAHNEYLNYLATTGTVGLGTYLFFIGFFITKNVIQFKNQKLKVKNEIQNSKVNKNMVPSDNFDFCLLPFALFSGWLSILVSNFFGFSVVIVSLWFYLIPALIFVLNNSQSFPAPSKPLKNPTVPLIFLLLVTFYLLLSVVNLWRADFFYSQGLKLTKQNEYSLAYQETSKAVNLSPQEPVFLSELSSNTATLALVSSLQKNATAAAELTKGAVAFSDRAIKESPKNINLWKTRIKVFYTLSTFDHNYAIKAIEATQEAIKLSPTDPKLVYNLGLLYGKVGKTEQAFSTIEKAIELKPNYEEARNALALFYEDLGQNDKAIEQLKIILQGKPNDPEIMARIEKLKK